MKKVITYILSIALAATMLFSFAGCFGDNAPEDATPKEYIIQYTDDAGTHKLTVTAGMPYSLDVAPTKNGYTFMGLYDAEVGGTQYISSNGASLSPFNDGKNMVLFPQFKAKDYTVILDYQGAPVTGSRQLTVAYGSSLPELPKNLTGEHKEFAGWYTEADCGGTQIADEYGLIPLVSVLNEQNFDLNSAITLYAGFAMEKHTVTFCFEAGIETEDVQVPYNTSISEVVPITRVNGNAVLTWSKTQGGEVWNGKVTDDMVLYAVEYAPVIELDSNGGSTVNPVVARAGSTVALPTPTKDLAKFSHWEDMSGNKFTSTAMPTNSTSLKAVWQAKIVFDKNGGSDVDDISVTAGTNITLPTPEKEGFIFAGWYTTEKDKYTSTTMPVVGIKLKAGWYKAKEKTVILTEANAHRRWASGWDIRVPRVDENACYEINVNEFANDEDINVKVDFYIKVRSESASVRNNLYVNFYSQKQISTNYLLQSANLGEFVDSYKQFSISVSFAVRENFFAVFYCSQDKYTQASDCYYTIHYPDTTNLYL